MPVTVARMKLAVLLAQHNITTIKELREKLGISRQHAWNLWHAEAGVGKAMMAKMHERLGIPYEELMQIDPITPPKPRGRPTKRKPDRDE